MRNEPATPVAVTLPATAGASAQARRIVGEAVAAWGVAPDVAEDAALVVTEMVSNAVDHAAGPVELSVSRTRNGGVRIEVSDSSPTQPSPRPIEVDSARGRGLIIIAALSREWGTTPTATGKTVWAELP
ncbi:ATP-binding protein [Saccharothrix variisporea]|uniref:Histidine kinase-like protein n=1 Tax=Saccharothrix variisporea TaxID=543527 RepID=A0A495XJ50_9PSEU|nr:ATP-binding protein [Saccharothrix variisporea]RKT74012.1 histidine kinase-like protein [Saccharothrix variisporea]